MEREYLRDDVLEYAYEWAYKRNPAYYDYDSYFYENIRYVHIEKVIF